MRIKKKLILLVAFTVVSSVCGCSKKEVISKGNSAKENEKAEENEKARQRRAFSRPSGAVSCRILPSAKQAGQAHRSAPHKIPYKSPALPDFYSTARAAAARPRPLCGREGVIAPGFSGTGGVSKGDSVPLRT